MSTPKRDELAAIIREAHLQWVLDGDAPDDAMPEWAADAIIAAGWSPTENREAAPDAFTDPDVTRICPTGCKERSPHRHERRAGKDWVLPAPTHNETGNGEAAVLAIRAEARAVRELEAEVARLADINRGLVRDFNALLVRNAHAEAALRAAAAAAPPGPTTEGET